MIRDELTQKILDAYGDYYHTNCFEVMGPDVWSRCCAEMTLFMESLFSDDIVAWYKVECGPGQNPPSVRAKQRIGCVIAWRKPDSATFESILINMWELT